MNCFPTDIQNIILDYKYQLEHFKKFKKSLRIIKNLKYKTYKSLYGYESRRYKIRNSKIYTIHYHQVINYKLFTQNFNNYNIISMYCIDVIEFILCYIKKNKI